MYIYTNCIRTVTPHSHLCNRTEHVKESSDETEKYTNNILRRNKFIMTA